MKSVQMEGCEFRTTVGITWCPGCPNHMILESVRRAIVSLEKQGLKDFTLVSGIGCHGKIFDYLNISGLYGLHGRPIPTGTGVKLGNPNLNVLVFAGDGDTYSEGMAHFIHACRNNPDITLFVHDNQAFSLTTGQATATSQKGYQTKAEPYGAGQPLNPLLLALSAGAGFVARCNARDLEHTQEVVEAAVKHKGFSFVEMIQDCLVYNKEINNKDKRMYKIEPKKFKEALVLAQEYDYNLGTGKIPLGILYKKERETLEDRWPQLAKLKKMKKSWKGLKR